MFDDVIQHLVEPADVTVSANGVTDGALHLVSPQRHDQLFVGATLVSQSLNALQHQGVQCVGPGIKI